MTTIDTPTDGTGGLGTVHGPSLSSRMRASWRADVWPSLWGVAIVMALILIAPYVIAFLLPASSGTVHVTVSSIAETLTIGVVVAAVIAACSASTGRREALLGGWTRRDRVQVTIVLAIGAAVAAAGVWLVFATIRPDLGPLLEPLGPINLVGWNQPKVSPLAAVIVAAIATIGVFVPSLIVGLARIHWLVVTIGAFVLAYLVATLGLAYGLVAYADMSLPVAATEASVSAPSLMTGSVTTGLVGAAVVVAASILLTLRIPVERYR